MTRKILLKISLTLANIGIIYYAVTWVFCKPTPKDLYLWVKFLLTRQEPCRQLYKKKLCKLQAHFFANLVVEIRLIATIFPWKFKGWKLQISGVISVQNYCKKTIFFPLGSNGHGHNHTHKKESSFAANIGSRHKKHRKINCKYFWIYLEINTFRFGQKSFA